MEEIWKSLDFVGCSHHEVSNFGRIRCISTGNCVKFGDNHGYYRVSLGIPGTKKQKHFLVARLVALAFIPNPDNKPQVDHINGVKTDNRVENLRWVTGEENRKNPVTRRKVFEVMHSDEYHNNMSNSVKKFQSTIEYSNKRSELSKNMWQKPEVREKMMKGRPAGRTWMTNGKDELPVFEPWIKDFIIFGWWKGRKKKEKN